MKYLGIDYGEKRIGISVSDDGGVIAFPHTTIENTVSILSDIKKICDIQKPVQIIIGMPMMIGGASPLMRAIERFGEDLSQCTYIPVVYENEIFTTKMAMRDGAKKNTVDQSSAALILQSYLDRQIKEDIVY
ncbi:MAG: Holliday junction resolvase RuvX [Candidatus Azambacteria bacterium]|nr:Holliday junction resolvase RuvX [Candidatus Azambacteria bacterium]